MRKLNVYCSIRSIGWNIVDDYGNEIIDYGVKRVNVDFDSYYAFIAGLPVAKRIERRMKRQARRNLWRFKTRRAKLIKLLEEDGIMPNIKFLHLVTREELNYLRDRYSCHIAPVGEKGEIGRVLLDIQAKRGYKSMRGVDDTGDSDYLKEIEMHENALKDYSTVGAYLNSLPSCKNVILRRETYENELRKICEVQGLDFEKYYAAIMYQRPLKKGKIAFCNLETNRKVTHASNPYYQNFRILRDVNNIEILDAENNYLEMTEKHRAAFLEHLSGGKDLTKAGALKIMGIKKPATYKWYCGKSIAGNFWAKLTSTIKTDIYAVWQDLISATDNTKLANILTNKYFSESETNALVDFDIKSYGYSDYSEKAIKKLIPIMENGKTLNEAILEVYGKVNLTAGIALRNVVLEQVFNSAKSLVSALKEKYDICEMQIEIDALLKMGNKARKARATANRREEKDSAELNKRIAEAGATANEYNRKKLRLYDETGGVCPYFPDEKIELKELFTDKYNIDHIVPKSKLFDFSDENLVIMPTKENTKKLRTTGADFADKNGNFDKYIEFANSLKISERKKDLLLMRENDIPTNYLSSRAGTDYNTRCFLTLHENARCIPNKLINMYSKSWYENPYDENDVRQSLIKSFVMANMDGKTIEYFDNIRENTREQTSSGAYDLQPDFDLPDFENLQVYCPKVKFFRRTKFGYISRFALHKESVYGKRTRSYRNAKGEIKEETFYRIRQPLGKLSANMVKNISDGAIRKTVSERFEKEGKNFAASIEENPPVFNGNPVKAVSVNVNGSALIPLHSSKDGYTKKFAEYDTKIDYVYSSMAFSIHIENGKKVITPLITAVKLLNSKEPLPEGLHKGDSVMYEGKQYIISGLDDSGIALRSVYTLLAENAIKLSKVSDIEKLKITKINQV